MDMELLLSLLQSRDTKQAYGTLLELERLSAASDALYPYTARFAEMAGSRQYAVRVRGFRLLCKQARWDTENIADQYIEQALVILNDEKPTALRQALAALLDVVPYKHALWDLIQDRVKNIDYAHYKDTVRGLIARDAQRLLDQIH